jgi:type IV pilus assembly protein PilC
MPKSFKWEGFEGTIMNEGVIEAENLDHAGNILSKRNIVVVALEEIISEKKGQDKAQNFDYKPKAIKNKHLVVFTKKLTTMIKSGLPILKTLEMLESQAENPHLKKVASKIKSDVESGTPLSDAFAQHPKVFDEVFINLMRAGEMSGKLTVFLEKLVIHLEKIEKIRKKVKGALTYPVIVMCVAVMVIMVMLIKVVPVFQNMFKSMGNELPPPTQFIVDVSEFLRDPSKGGVVIGVIVFAFIFIIKAVKSNPVLKYKFDKLILKTPLFGDLIQKSSLSKIAMVQSNLSAAGVSVIETLDIVAKSITNSIFREAFEGVKKGISQGENLSELYAKYKVFPPTFYQMIAVGEETGRVDEMLSSLAIYYEEEFDTVVDRLTEMLEPIMIVFMGATVGFIIIAMYMPIFKIGDAISGDGNKAKTEAVAQ